MRHRTLAAGIAIAAGLFWPGSFRLSANRPLDLSRYCTQVTLEHGVRISLYTPAMFRIRTSLLQGDKFPAKYEIPFAIGKLENWAPVTHRHWKSGADDYIETDRLRIRVASRDRSWTVWTREGTQIYPSEGPIRGMFRDGYALFDSASAFGERNNNSRFAHWFYNPQTRRYVDTYLSDDLIFDQYFVYGPGYRELFRQLNELIGPEPLLPKKAYGFFQTQHLGCKGNQSKLLELARTLRDRNIPVDNLIVDFEWGDGCPGEDEKYWGGLDWAPAYSTPLSPAEMVAQLHQLHYNVMLIHHSAPDFPHRAEDTPKRVRDWTSKVYDEGLWWKKLKEKLDIGVDGTWQDTRQNDVTDSVIWQGLQDYFGPHRRVLFLGCRKMMDLNPFEPDRDNTIPANSLIGTRRYPFTWTEDIDNTYRELQWQIKGITDTHGAMKAVTYITADGFAKDWKSHARWNQFLSFLPVARSHTLKPWETKSEQGNLAQAGTGRDSKESAMVENSVRKHLKLRYRLLPYIYSAAYENYRTGMPIARPMLLAFPEDVRCNSDQWPYQYMFGEALLVCPVYADLNSMEIYLPKGSDWIDYWSKQVYSGGQVIGYDTSDVGKLPLFVRSGGILPMRQESYWIDPGVPDDPLTLDVYPSSQPSSFTLYEDDGQSTLYQSGQSATTTFESRTESGGDVLVLIGESKGDYSGKPKSRTFLVDINLAGSPARVTHNGAELGRKETAATLDQAVQGWFYDQNRRLVRIKLKQSALEHATIRLSRGQKK